MVRKAIRNLCLGVLLMSLCTMLGCATYSGSRFYSGPPLPKNKTILVYAVSGCAVEILQEKREKEEKLLFYYTHDNNLFELLPGQYTLYFTYYSPGDGAYHKIEGGTIRRDLYVKEGESYIFYPEITETAKKLFWRPIIVELGNYIRGECQKNNRFGECPDISSINKWGLEYLQSDRHIRTYNRLGKPYVINVEGGQRVFNGYWF